MPEAINYSAPGPVAEDYLLDRSPVSIIEGPVGSGKTVATLMKGFTVSVQQEPFKGVRYSRGVIIRNTYRELKSTVIKSFLDWFGGIAVMNWGEPITATLRFPLPDGTKLDCEIFFLSFDRPDDVGKLKSFEVTWAGLSEASELAKTALDMSSQRVGRYPPVRQGGPTWYGVFGDTNMPDDDHFLYKLFEKERAKGYKLFRQPGGLIEQADGSYIPNPAAENIENLPGGYEYYFRQIAGKSKEWIKVFILAQYGTIADGRPVYPEWNDELHCRKAGLFQGLPLLLGFDYGLTPACVVCQISPRGQLLILDELFAKDMGIRQFARDVVRPHLAINYPKHGFQAVGDPAGSARSDTDEKTCFMELAEEGIPAAPATTNSFVGRREAVAKYLTRLVDGKPALILDPKCDMLRRGFNGRYQYKRLQVVGEERYRDVPDKNDYSHLQDALQYAALHSQTMNNSQEWSKPIKYPKSGIV